MIGPPSRTKIWFAAGVTDRRSGFNSLAGKVQTVLERDPFSGHVFVLPCDSRQGFAAVVELLGQRDVSDELATHDVDALLDFLRMEGFVADRPAGTQRKTPAIAALEAVDHLKAAQTGMVTWHVPVEARVARNEVIAEIVGEVRDRTASDRARTGFSSPECMSTTF